MKKAQLILKDGTILEGKSFGAEVPSAGEVVFNTSMVGYPESFTDPSYTGQIMVLTYPLIGNYGVPDNALDVCEISENFESPKIHIKGLIVTEYSENHNHWKAKNSLSDWLKANGVPAITGIDTRMLTEKLREHGTMLGKIVVEETLDSKKSPNSKTKKPESSKKTKFSDIDFYNPDLDNLVNMVSATGVKVYEPNEGLKNPNLSEECDTKFDKNSKKTENPASSKSKKSKSSKKPKTVICIDCGMKNNILRHLLDQNLKVIRVPWDFDFIEAGQEFDGIFLSNGPGDPELLTPLHKILKKAFKLGKPIFGICLGSQIMGLAAGAKTYKLKYGHRSQNQPCVDEETGRCYITSQNHGFAIKEKSLPKDWKVWLRNANDKTIEGIKHKTKPFFSCQFHPEAMPGPTDTKHFFKEFADML